MRGIFRCLWCAALTAQSVPTDLLEPGKPVSREIGKGESHTYTLSIEANQYVFVTAEQQAVDLAISLLDPDGKKLVEVDRLPESGTEDIGWIASRPGVYKVAIRASKNALPGGYRVEVQRRATPSAEDQARFDAFRLTWIDARELRAHDNAESMRAAAAKYEQSVPLWRKAGDGAWEGYAWYQLSVVSNRLGQTARARECLLAALPLQRAAGEHAAESNTLNGLGIMAYRLGDTKQSNEYHSMALAISRSLGDRGGEAVALANLGVNYNRQGDRANALDYLLRSLAIRRELDDRSDEASSLSNLAMVYRALGQEQKALEYLAESLSIQRAIGDRRGQASSLNGLGQSYYLLGDADKAIEDFKQAESLYRELGRALGISSMLTGLGNASNYVRKFQEAVEYYQRGVELDRQGSSKQGEATGLVNMCYPLVDLGRTSEALTAGEQALSINRKIGYQRGVGTALKCLGEAHAKLGELDKARDYLTESAAIHRSADNLPFLAPPLGVLAQVERDSGNLKDALARIEEAVKVVGTLRASLDSANLRASLTAARFNILALNIDVLMRMHAADAAGGFDARALEASERWRARSLIEMVGETRGELRQELTAEQRSREDQILARISSLQKELFRPSIPAARTDRK